jgi:serine O-acetyltransferase
MVDASQLVSARREDAHFPDIPDMMSPGRSGRPDRPATPTPRDLPSWEYLGFWALVGSDIQVWGEMLAFKGKGEAVPLHTAIRLALVYAGLRATILHRLAYATHRARIPIVPMILTNLNLFLHGFDIPPHIEVGPRFYVPHPVGTVVTARRLGARVTLVSVVTIGMRNGSDFPVLEDDVYVGAGARVLGAITLGKRAQIGANAVVLKDVPADHVAVGVPAMIRPAKTTS